MMVPEAINTYKNGKILLKTQNVSTQRPGLPYFILLGAHYQNASPGIDTSVVINGDAGKEIVL